MNLIKSKVTVEKQDHENFHVRTSEIIKSS